MGAPRSDFMTQSFVLIDVCRRLRISALRIKRFAGVSQAHLGSGSRQEFFFFKNNTTYSDKRCLSIRAHTELYKKSAGVFWHTNVFFTR